MSGAFMDIRMGRWSEPMEGREVFQLEKNGKRASFVKAMSSTPRHVDRLKGNIVKVPHVLITVKPF